ncbi:MBL fold metallo-hydrolase [Mycobacterium sp. M1]|uniref:MBL fold metallo-hydrolase n=1 Tax=Mycolicibacter acidiphilus TaxID=2835306 RepID=A0ABS5RG73_9MYCO|nr:MBL fold metallo-hydrolase [Mycolicibacter acidiphilus]MBS9533283.1 MBL fold metallo-hydrolase [Mycolicibacter acidiphilus]
MFQAKFERNAADGVHRLEHASTNLYLIEDGTGITVVDAGLPSTYRHLLAALTELGRSPRDVRAIILTHAHFDHIGFARRAHRTWGVPVWVHTGDRFLAAHPGQYQHEHSRLPYPVRYPKALPHLAKIVAAGAFFVPGIADTTTFEDGAVLDVPGQPRVIFTPGHTPGSCVFHLPDRNTVISGDTLVTLNFYAGRVGPQIIAGAATADSATALASLSAVADTGAEIMLPGHGEPWRKGVASAVEQALRAGPS